jgi:hypothetical protein
MSQTRRNALVAGLLYLLLILAAPVRLLVIPGKLLVAGDPAATAANLVAHETLFRLGILADLFCGVVVVFLSLALYRLFEGVDRRLGATVVIVGGVLPAAIDFLNTANDAAALMLARGADVLSAIEKPQRDALAVLFLRLHHQVIVGAQILWGAWLFPLALLTLRSGFLPRFLGWWLLVNGTAYVALSLTGLLRPSREATASAYAFPALLGEIAFMVALLVLGARGGRLGYTAGPPGGSTP